MNNQSLCFVSYNMGKISKEISKKVVSLDSGNIIGYVIDVLFDESLHTIKGFLIVDDESEEVFFLGSYCVFSKSNECFMVESESNLELYISSLFNNPIGKSVYDENGLNLGRVIDVYFEKDAVKKIVTNKCEFPVQYLKKAGNHCLIYGKTIAKTKKRNVSFQTKQNMPSVHIQSEVGKLENKTNEYPIRIRTKNERIIGKRVTKQVLGLNNELIAKENDVVTKNMIQKAKLHNRYNLLMFYVE